MYCFVMPPPSPFLVVDILPGLGVRARMIVFRPTMTGMCQLRTFSLHKESCSCGALPWAAELGLAEWSPAGNVADPAETGR
jgi:hypothetical protein